MTDNEPMPERPWSPRAPRSRTPRDAPVTPVVADVAPHAAKGPAEVAAEDVAMSDAVVGWLVIVAGPGRGADFRLLAGINGVGSGANIAIDLAFGDRGIAAGSHCRVTFDPRSKLFFLSPGDGRHITYSAGEPVLSTVKLAAMQDFEVGATTLRFVPFCSPDFTWADI